LLPLASFAEGMVWPKAQIENEGISTLNAQFTHNGWPKIAPNVKQNLLNILSIQLTQKEELELTKSLHLRCLKLDGHLQLLKMMLRQISSLSLDTNLYQQRNYLHRFLVKLIPRLKQL
jgi:hypothetical protein